MAAIQADRAAEGDGRNEIAIGHPYELNRAPTGTRRVNRAQRGTGRRSKRRAAGRIPAPNGPRTTPRRGRFWGWRVGTWPARRGVGNRYDRPTVEPLLRTVRPCPTQPPGIRAPALRAQLVAAGFEPSEW